MKLFKNFAGVPGTRHAMLVGRFTMFFLTCLASLSWAQPSYRFNSFSNPDPLLLFCPSIGLQSRDNEFAYSGQALGNFYCNPLTLDGMAFDYNAFTLKSTGELRLIKGDAQSGKVVEIPFYLRLRRNGILVAHPCGEGVMFSKIEISAILKVAKDGDELIVEPVNKEDWPAKRIVKIGWDGC